MAKTDFYSFEVNAVKSKANDANICILNIIESENMTVKHVAGVFQLDQN